MQINQTSLRRALLIGDMVMGVSWYKKMRLLQAIDQAMKHTQQKKWVFYLSAKGAVKSQLVTCPYGITWNAIDSIASFQIVNNYFEIGREHMWLSSMTCEPTLEEETLEGVLGACD